MEVQTQVNEAIGYVMKLHKVNKFLLEDEMLEEANRMIDQILEINDISNKMLCCGQVNTSLELNLDPKIMEQHSSEASLLEFIRKVRRRLLSSSERYSRREGSPGNSSSPQNKSTK